MQNLVVLTGAGISAESGLPTFRAADGLWEGHRIEEVATPEAFRRNPALVQQFYNARRRALATVAPNAAHLALAELEQKWRGDSLLVTQNVDDLHERAGSRQLVHMHGELKKVRCVACGFLGEWLDDLSGEIACPACQRATLRPHIVWFGEIPLEMEMIAAALERADFFVSIGTSGQVYPAAGFVEMAREAGAHTIEINLEPSAQHSRFDEHRLGLASVEVPALVREFLTR